MDYWKTLELFEYENWDKFLKSKTKPKNIYLFTTHASRTLWQTTFAKDDGLLFGNEGKGAPDEIHQWAKTNRITIPKYKDGLRSLNLAVSVGIATYEALRQINT
jgi:tRNA (cytidine/uridine-2'-O-)-methyltransferase